MRIWKPLLLPPTVTEADKQKIKDCLATGHVWTQSLKMKEENMRGCKRCGCMEILK